MSTIASPRASSSIRSPSSTRTSFDASARPATSTRRNRAALRDYYGLKSAPKDGDAKISEESTRTELGPELEEETLTELDKEDFHAEAFVNNILATSGLSGVLKVEADLVSRMLQAHRTGSVRNVADLGGRDKEPRQRSQVTRLRQLL
jgi:hypothetical protein